MTRLPPMALLLLLWAAGLGAAAQFGKISVLYADLRALYGGGGEAALGLVVSVVGLVGLVFGTTAGVLVARLGPRRVLVAGLALGALVSGLQALLPPFPAMLAARVLEGVSHLAIVVVGPVLIASLAPEGLRPLAMTLWSSFFGVTYAGLALLAPLFAGPGGAAALFVSHGAWMAALALVLAAVLPPDPPRPPSGTGNLLAQHVAIYASPWLSAPAMGFCFYTFLYVALLTLVPPAAPPSVRGLMATGMPLASIVVSLTLGVWLLSRLRAVHLVQAGYAAALPGVLALGLFWGQGPGMAAAGLWLAAALGIVQGASFAALAELNPAPADRARAAGAVAQLGNLGTTSGTPVLAALLVAAGPWALVIVAALACAAGIAAHSLQARRRQTRTT